VRSYSPHIRTINLRMFYQAFLCCFLFAGSAFARPAAESPALIGALGAFYQLLHPELENEPRVETGKEHGVHFEGDIALTEDEANDKQDVLVNALNVVVSAKRWDYGIVYYSIKADNWPAGRIGDIKAAMRMIEQATAVNGNPCIQYRQRTTQSAYLYIQLSAKDEGCYTYLGKSAKQPQTMKLEAWCPVGSIAHEFIHALGFDHEQRRHDRDDYIWINWNELPNDDNTRWQYQKYTAQQNDPQGTRYDYGSIMHYPANRGILGGPIIIPKQQGVKIGQRIRPSAIDIERIQLHYGCIKPSDSVYFKHLDDV